MKNGAATVETSMKVPQKIKNRTAIYASKSTCEYCLKRIKSKDSDTCTLPFPEALFMIPRRWKHPFYLSTDDGYTKRGACRQCPIEIDILGALSFCHFRATPMAHGGSQVRRWIRAVTTNLHHSHSNARSLTHWTRPAIKSASSWVLVRFFSTEPRWELPRQCNIFFYGLTQSTWKVLGQGLNPSHSSDNTESLTTRPPETPRSNIIQPKKGRKFGTHDTAWIQATGNGPVIKVQILYDSTYMR